jgi:hypothetical protein
VTLRYEATCSACLTVLLWTAAIPLSGQVNKSGISLTPLFSHIWQVSNGPSKLAPGSIYIFLPNGTLLETSCVETYRIATWTIDKQMPRLLHVREDKELAFTAEITNLSETTLEWTQRLVRGREKRKVHLQAVENEYVCPDLPK